MNLFLMIVIITVLSLAISKGLKVCISDASPLSVCMIILTLYLFGLIEKLNWGFWFIIILTVFSACYIMSSIKELILEYMTKEYVIFLLIVIISYFLMRDRLVMWGDEFTHWALSVKNIWLNDSILGENNTVLFVNYSPGMAIWQWFVLRISGHYVEGYLYWAYAIFIEVLVLPIIHRIETKRWEVIVFLFLPWLTMPYIVFTFFYIGLQIDAAMALLFAQLLYLIYSKCKDNKRILDVQIYISICVLTLLKDSGLVLALFSLVLLGIVLYNRKNRKHGVKFLLPLTLLTILIKVSWQLYWTKRGGSDVGLRFTEGNYQSYSSDVLFTIIGNFWRKLQEGIYTIGNIKISYWAFVVILIALLVVFIKTQRKQYRKISFVYGTCLMIIFFLYTLSLLYLYLSSFSKMEALKVASFRRYMGTMILPVLLFYLYVIIGNIENYSKRVKNITRAAIFILTLILGIELVETVNLKYNIPWRDTFAHIENFEVNADDRVYVIHQHDSGVTYVVANYLLTPAHTQEHYLGTRHNDLQYTFSLGKPDEGETKEMRMNYDIDAETWEQILVEGKYTYVYLHGIDEAFIDNFGILFADKDNIQERMFYRVKRDSGHISLEKVENN